MNTIQAIDAYLVREVRRQCIDHEINLVSIHDCFRCHPEDMGYVRHFYRDALARIASTNYFSKIISQYRNKPFKYEKKSTNLDHKIRNSRYLLS